MSSLLSKPLVGVDIGSSGIKAVEISAGKNPRLIAYNRIALPWDVVQPDGEIKNKAVVISGLRKLFDTKVFTTKRVAMGAFGNSIITKKVTMPRMTAREVADQLYWEAEQYIPFDIKEINLDFFILGSSSSTTQSQVGQKPMMEVMLVAAKKDYIANLKSIAEEAGLKLDGIDHQAFSLGNAFEFNYGYLSKDSFSAANVLIDFGAGSTKVVIVEGDKTTFSRELRQSGNGITQLIAERRGLTIDEAERAKIAQGEETAYREVIDECVSLLVDEVSRTLDFAATQGSERVYQKVYICGGAASTAGLLASLESKLPLVIETLNPIKNIAGSGRKMNIKAVAELSGLGAVALGLSLRNRGDRS